MNVMGEIVFLPLIPYKRLNFFFLSFMDLCLTFGPAQPYLKIPGDTVLGRKFQPDENYQYNWQPKYFLVNWSE